MMDVTLKYSKNNDFPEYFLFLSRRNPVFCDFPFCTQFL